MYTVYAIKSTIKEWIYVGMTSNLEERLKKHNSGHNKSTKPYAPFTLVYSETQPDRISARKKEKYLKSSSGKRWLKYQI